MKYNRLLFIFVVVGVALSACFMSQESATNRATTGNLHTCPLPYFVRHNPGAAQSPTVTPSPSPAVTPYITAHLVPDNNNQSYIEYWITDKWGPGNTHSKKSGNNEDPTSSLFTTTFPLADIVPTPTNDGEVIIQGTGTDGQCYAWKSISKNRISKDCDVLWKPVKCK
ncbi:MAG: hypothetical protein JOZ31_06730 [Verrucomicrobia bacterium]|nr:hypothetical protein [Verrucomicrobiota bacterium]MBV8484147.1 hypothetical protein [Verrucomicrobiota bacterium]